MHDDVNGLFSHSAVGALHSLALPASVPLRLWAS